MPYADPDQQREYNRNWQRTRYQHDAEFREAEAWRKKPWHDKNAERIRQQKRNYRFIRRGQRLYAKLPGWMKSIDLRSIKPIRQLGLKNVAQVLKQCREGTFPAFRIANKWYSSKQMIALSGSL